MRSLCSLFPHVAARRVWNSDGTRGWEFRFTPRDPPKPIEDAVPRPQSRPERPAPVRFVSSRGVEIGADTLRIEQVHHRIRKPALALSPGPPGRAGTDPVGTDRADVAAALVDLATDPDDEAGHRRVIARLAGVDDWVRRAAVLEISATRISGAGLGDRLDGVFVWRAEGGRDLSDHAYLVAPDPDTRELLKADPDLVRALIRVACPRPDDALGELEENLREALTRLGVAADHAEPAGRAPSGRDRAGRDRAGRDRAGRDRAGRDRAGRDRAGRDRAGRDRVRRSDRAGRAVVLEVDLEPAHPEPPPVDPAKSASERALSEELAVLARKVRAG